MKNVMLIKSVYVPIMEQILKMERKLNDCEVDLKNLEPSSCLTVKHGMNSSYGAVSELGLLGLS